MSYTSGLGNFIPKDPVPLSGAEENMKITFQNIGWKSKIMQKRATFSISINKLVAIGCDLKKAQTLYCYLAHDKNKRPIMIAYLDSKKRDVQ